MRSQIDLHLHTTCSDGTLTPTETVEEALRRGMTLIAITDHDTLEGVDPAIEAAKDTKLSVLTGIEFNTDYRGQEVHILGYDFKPDAPAVYAALQSMRDGRANRNDVILERLKELGLPLEMERVKEIAQGEIVARPHIAKAMLEAGYVKSSQEAFDLYLKKGAKAFIERYSLTPQQACLAILESDGLPVLAHPAKTDYNSMLDDLLPCGLRGLEAYHFDHTTEQSRRFKELARQHGLLITGGTDSHGPHSARPVEMGSVWIPDEVIKDFHTELEQRRKQRETPQTKGLS